MVLDMAAWPCLRSSCREGAFEIADLYYRNSAAMPSGKPWYSPHAYLNGIGAGSGGRRYCAVLGNRDREL